MIYGDHRLFIQFNTILELNNTSLITLNPQRTERLKLIKSLSDGGMSNVEISDYLNSKGVKTPKGKDYYPKLFLKLKVFNSTLLRDLLKTRPCLLKICNHTSHHQLLCHIHRQFFVWFDQSLD